MSEQTTQAASSPAEQADVFNGENVSMAEYTHFREKNELPDRFKPAEPADPAPADVPEERETEGEKPEPAPDSDPVETQEHPQKGAEKRIKQLLARTKELERKLEETAKQTAKPESSPAQPQNYQEYRAAFKPSEYVEWYAKQHPEASYEDANAAMADHLADAREHFRGIEERDKAQRKALEAKVGEARTRYEDFDEILGKVFSEKGTPLIPLPVLEIINDSEYLADLLYTIGNDEEEMSKFIEMAKSSPNKAIRYVAKVENLIAEELSKTDKKITPEPPKPSAPKPPSIVGGGSSRAFDVSDESLSADAWFIKRNQQLSRQ